MICGNNNNISLTLVDFRKVVEPIPDHKENEAEVVTYVVEDSMVVVIDERMDHAEDTLNLLSVGHLFHNRDNSSRLSALLDVLFLALFLLYDVASESMLVVRLSRISDDAIQVIEYGDFVGMVTDGCGGNSDDVVPLLEMKPL